MLKRVTNLVDSVFLLQDKNDSQPFSPNMKSSAFGVLPLFVILDNISDFFGIFEHLQSQDGVISVGKGYKSGCFRPSATGQTLDIATTA